MGRTYPQSSKEVFRITSGCFTANGASSGSHVCRGYSQLVGFFRSDASTVAASGLKIRQSVDGGVNWDYVSASDQIAEGGSTACIMNIIGDAVRIDVTLGDDEASSLRMGFWLRPI